MVGCVPLETPPPRRCLSLRDTDPPTSKIAARWPPSLAETKAESSLWTWSWYSGWERDHAKSHVTETGPHPYLAQGCNIAAHTVVTMAQSSSMVEVRCLDQAPCGTQGGLR